MTDTELPPPLGRRTILDLCGGTGSWSAPYRAAGYDVVIVDLGDEATPPVGDVPGLVREDVRLWQPPPGFRAHGILAAPPCTVFAVSGAQWWTSRDPDGKRLLEGLAVVDACLRLIARLRPAWWALENPVGRLRGWLGDPAMTFHPYEYGDPYPKRTLLWGDFTKPPKSPVEPTDDRIHTMSPGPERARVRSMTPPGFARAFYEANP